MISATLRALARTEIATLIARHELGMIDPSESVALAFCAASLIDGGDVDDLRRAECASLVCQEAQERAGGWPLGRVVGSRKDIEGVRLEIPTHEIAWALADSVTVISRKSRTAFGLPILNHALPSLEKSFEFVLKSAVRLKGTADPREGWCSDHPYGRPMIESWTSATVIQLAMSLHSLSEESTTRRFITSFDSADPRDWNWPAWLHWNQLRSTNEPDDDHPILEYIESKIIKPIRESPRTLPSPKSRTVSCLLFGPPGTQKTTIVKAVAEALDWPVVTVSPGVFIEKGLEYIEAQAGSVFTRLQMLSRVVVLFDECDELFRSRFPKADSEQSRNITAFVTASMLPKLQELHDKGKVVFFMCTNHVRSMDNAVLRGGRTDHVIAVGPPDREARRRIVLNTIQGHTTRAFMEDATEVLSALTVRFSRSELERAAQLLVSAPPWSSSHAAKKEAKRIWESFQRGLTITESVFKDFLEDRKNLSMPHQGH